MDDDYKLFRIGRKIESALVNINNIVYDYIVARDYNSAVQLWQEHCRSGVELLPESVVLFSRTVIVG